MILLQKATTEHIPIIQKIAQSTWPNTFREILIQEQLKYMMKWMYSTPSLVSQMAEKNHIFYLAWDEENPVGFASFELGYEGKKVAKIHKLYILPDAQGKGIGKRLVNKVSDLAQQKDINTLLLNVNKFNQPALDFYIKMGFVIINKEIIPIGKGYVMDDFILVKK